MISQNIMKIFKNLIIINQIYLMKFDVLKILIIQTILISVFFMTKYEAYGGKGDYILHDNSYILPLTKEIHIIPQESIYFKN